MDTDEEQKEQEKRELNVPVKYNPETGKYEADNEELNKKVEEINKILNGELKTDDQQKYFGLRNVDQRLKLMYGGDSGLKVESIKGEKTTVTIKINQRGGD